MLHISQLQLPTGQVIDLDIKAGEIHCLRGDSGVGKTRLLRALADLDACAGQITLNDAKLADQPAPQWRSQVMLVPARPRWWLATAAEHMARDMSEVAKRLRLSDKQLSCPTERLSTGESSRLALLRALSCEPPVLLLDEPTAALDDSAEAAVEELLDDYLQADPKRCILWITHSRAQAQRMTEHRWRLTAEGLEPDA